MLKKFVSSLICLLMLVGCSSGQSETTATTSEPVASEPATEASAETTTETVASTYDVKAIGEGLVNELQLSGTTTLVDTDTASALFQLDPTLISDAAVYIANDNTADVVAVISTSDPAKVKEGLQNYLSVTTDTFKAYAPEEATKCENAIIKDKNDLVFFVISNNQEAADGYIFNIQ